MIESTALAMLVARDVTIREINSARPHAPVVAVRTRAVRARAVRERPDVSATVRGRLAVAAVLRRAADAVAPSCPPHAAAH